MNTHTEEAVALSSLRTSLANTFPVTPDERELAESIVRSVEAAHVETVRITDTFMEPHREKAARPQRDAALRQVDQLEARGKALRETADATLEAFATGRRVKQPDGSVVDVPTPTVDAVSEIRSMEIRNHFRSLPAAERFAAISAAVHADDREVLDALQRAPKSMALFDESSTRLLRETRIDRSGFRPEHQKQTDHAFHLRYFAERARKALGIKD